MQVDQEDQRPAPGGDKKVDTEEMEVKVVHLTVCENLIQIKRNWYRVQEKDVQSRLLGCL